MSDHRFPSKSTLLAVVAAAAVIAASAIAWRLLTPLPRSKREAVETASMAAALARIESRLERLETRLTEDRERAAASDAAAAPAGSAVASSGASAGASEIQKAIEAHQVQLKPVLEKLAAGLDELRGEIQEAKLTGRRYTSGLEGSIGGTGWIGEPAPAEPPDMEVQIAAYAHEEAGELALEVSWSVLGGATPPSGTDWLAVYKVDADNRDYKDWKYTGGAASGKMRLKLPVEPGIYEIRYLLRSGYVSVPYASPSFEVSSAAGADAEKR